MSHWQRPTAPDEKKSILPLLRACLTKAQGAIERAIEGGQREIYLLLPSFTVHVALASWAISLCFVVLLNAVLLDVSTQKLTYRESSDSQKGRYETVAHLAHCWKRDWRETILDLSPAFVRFLQANNLPVCRAQTIVTDDNPAYPSR